MRRAFLILVTLQEKKEAKKRQDALGLWESFR
jgi:hypothetical protein